MAFWLSTILLCAVDFWGINEQQRGSSRGAAERSEQRSDERSAGALAWLFLGASPQTPAAGARKNAAWREPGGVCVMSYDEQPLAGGRVVDVAVADCERINDSGDGCAEAARVADVVADVVH